MEEIHQHPEQVLQVLLPFTQAQEEKEFQVNHYHHFIMNLMKTSLNLINFVLSILSFIQFFKHYLNSFFRAWLVSLHKKFSNLIQERYYHPFNFLS